MTRPDPTRLPAAAMLFSALAAAIPSVVLGVRLNADLMAGGLINPDSSMRMVRLDAIVAAGQPLQAVMRDSSGAGSVMSWSHLLDSILALLATPLAGWLGWPAALHVAGLAWGPLGFAALGVAMAWAAAPVAASRTLWLAALVAGFTPALAGYGLFGVVHHHTALTIAPVMAAGWALRLLRGHDPASGGMAMGAWTALGVWFSPEALPFALMAQGALWVDWLHAPARPRSLAMLAAAAAMTVLIALAWLADPPPAGLWAADPDRLSLSFVLLALGAALASLAAYATGRRFATLAVASALALSWLAAFPQVLHGTSGLMTPEQAAAFFGPIAEMQPVRGLDGIMQKLIGGMFALACLLAFAWRRRGQPSCVLLLYAAGCVIVMLALASQHIRFSSYPAAAGAVLLPAAITAVSARTVPALLQSFARVSFMLLPLMSPALAPLAAAAKPVDAAKPCPVSGAVALAAVHAGEIVLGDVDATPDLLYRTQVLTVGSLYHRAPAGFMRLRAAWRSIPGDSPDAGPTPELLATGASLVLACPHGPRSPLTDGLPQTTLLDRLVNDQPPPFLHRVADAGPGGYVLYAVKR